MTQNHSPFAEEPVVPQVVTPNAGNQIPGKQSGSNTTVIILVAIAALSIPLLGCCAGLLLPAVQAAREAARRMNCSNNIKQIGLAMHNYHSAYNQLPPAYTVDGNGRRLHSWRTFLLPFMEQQALFAQIDLTKPWDDPVNQLAADTFVPAYGCPSMGSDSTLTGYQAIVDISGIMTGPVATKFRDVTDGLANTVMIVEMDESRAVHWMSPEDTDASSFLNVGNGAPQSSSHMGGRHVLMADGTVNFIADSIDPNLSRALVTKAGGETF